MTESPVITAVMGGRIRSDSWTCDRNGFVSNFNQARSYIYRCFHRAHLITYAANVLRTNECDAGSGYICTVRGSLIQINDLREWTTV